MSAKRAYFVRLKEARRLGEHSIDGAAAALAKFEDYTRFRDFKKFRIRQAIGFKTACRTGADEGLSARALPC